MKYNQQINLVFFENAKEMASKAKNFYYVENVEDNLYIISEAPIIFRNRLEDLFDNLAFDFDTLEDDEKKILEMKKTTFTKTNQKINNKTIYKQETKIYQKKSISKL